MPTSTNTSKMKVLMVDDDADVCRLFQTHLKNAGFEVEFTGSTDSAVTRLKEVSFDILLLDLTLGSVDGLEEMPRLMSAAPATRIWVLTANSSIGAAVRAMKLGAAGFFSKSQSIEEIVTELKAGSPNEEETEDPIKDKESEELTGICGQSQAIKKVRQNIFRMKDVDSTVLITGESGTGKELIARALHRVSRRGDQKFAAINCGAIPEALLESELFGHKRGAFTDAKMSRVGYFELCSDGTLLLDEIGELPILLQVKLLRVLQEKEFQVVGGSETVKVNTRVIASTNRDLSEEVREGRFREDLFYRLSVLSIESPPLRKRREDILVLADIFIKRFAERFGKTIAPISNELQMRLLAYEWPGNVRELQNAIERAVVLSIDGQLQIEDVFQSNSFTEATDSGEVGPLGDEGPVSEYSSALKGFEKKYILKLLRATRGNISEASRISGEYRPHLYRLIKKYRIDPAEFKT